MLGRGVSILLTRYVLWGFPAVIVRGSIPAVAGMLAIRASSGAWLYNTPEVVVPEIGALPTKVLAVCLLYGSIFLCQLYRPRTDIINCYEKRKKNFDWAINWLATLFRTEWIEQWLRSYQLRPYSSFPMFSLLDICISLTYSFFSFVQVGKDLRISLTGIDHQGRKLKSVTHGGKQIQVGEWLQKI